MKRLHLMTPPALRFAILARVSTREQLSGHSLTIQKSDGKKYIDKCGGELTKIYEAQESATTEDREVLGQVLRDAGKEFTDLVVQDTSRLSRNPAVMFQAMTTLAKADVKLHDFRGPLPFDTPEGEFRLMIDSVVGRFTSRQSVRKSLDARQRILEEGGIAAGRPPWGRRWQKSKKQFAVIPHRLDQIKRAFDLIVNQRYSLIHTARELGIASSSLTKAVSQAALTKVVQRLRGHTYSIPCPQLLDSFRQKRILQRLNENTTVRPTTKGSYLLQGLVRCDSCHATMTGQTSTKDGYRYSVYRHPSMSYKGKQSLCTWSVPVELLDDNVLTACAEVVKNGKTLRQAIEAALADAKTDRNELTRRRMDLETRISSANKQLDGLVDALTKLSAKGEAHLRTLRRIHRLEQILSIQRADFTEVVRQLETMLVPNADTGAIAAKLRNLYWGSGGAAKVMLSFEQRRAFVRAIVGRMRRDSDEGIFVRMIRPKDKSKKDVYWRYQIRGHVALIDSYIDRNQEEGYPEILELRPSSKSAVTQLAAVARSGLGMENQRVQKINKYSSGA